MQLTPAALDERDPLTGLVGRATFRRMVRAALAADAAEHHAAAVIVLDIDRFRLVNEALGYRVGDLALQRVAARLTDEMGRDRVLARLGGNTFAVLLPGLPARTAASLMQAAAMRLHHALADSTTIESHAVDTHASIGMALWPRDATEADTLVHRAEAAMYMAKRRREGPLAFDQATHPTQPRSVSLLGELRQAVDEGQLRLHLQPQRSLRCGRVAGAEALIRWQHPRRGLLMPREFIPFAEQTGFIRLLTLWMLDEAARTWKSLAATSEPFVLSINLSAHDLQDAELAPKFAAVLQRHGLPAEAFCLELTEGAVMDEPELAVATLQQLRGLGFRLSIDDFGTGHSALSYLKRLPVDELKIDQAFVLGMADDESDACIVRSTIDLAHGLGLRVVAEGVEDAAVCALLQSIGCDLVQGTHIGPPMPVPQFSEWRIAQAARPWPASPRHAPFLALLPVPCL